MQTFRKKKAEWKHVSEQQHDVFGPPALTWFLNKYGMTKYSKSFDAYYPVAFKDLDVLITNTDVQNTHFTKNTCAVHLWGRRMRWRLPGLGMEEGGFVHNSLKKLEINPQLAPLEKEQEPDIWAPARLLPRTSTHEQIVETCEIKLNHRQQRWIKQDETESAIRLAEQFLRQAKDNNLFGINDAAPEKTLRGVDHHGTDAAGAFRIANSFSRYASHHNKLPNLMHPKGFTEHAILWKHLGPMPFPTPADKLYAHKLVPKDLSKNVVIPERPWVSDTPSLPQNGEIPDGVYFLKANHSHGATRIQYPISDAEREQYNVTAQNYLVKPHGFWGGEWWYMHIQRQLFLERHLDKENPKADVPDWKFWTFGGKVEMVQVDLDRLKQHTQYIHDRDLNLLNEKLYYDPGPHCVERPDTYDSMIEIAEAVGRNVEFARIDLYNTANGIVVGEVTLCPNGASFKIQSRSLDLRLGKAFAKTEFFRVHQS